MKSFITPIAIRKIGAQVLYDNKSVDIGGNVKIASNENQIKLKDDSMTFANVTRALTKLGAKPKDIISILENIKRAGAIRAKLEVI